MGRGGNFEKRRNTPLGNVVRNKHTKFEQDRSTGSVLKIGGKKESGEGEEEEGEIHSRP